MKSYRVLLTPEAEAGIQSAFDYIQNESPPAAARWLQDLYNAIVTLETLPERCSVAREQEYFDEDLRQLLFKSHRIVFRIEPENIVRVLHVRHSKRRTLGEA